MIQIGLYSEFFAEFAPEMADSYPRMADNLSAAPVPHKEQIIRYLHSGELGSMPAGGMRDVLTGKVVNVRDNDRNDGVYEWGEGLAYYVDKYNLMLPSDFVEHILRVTNQN